MTACVVCSHLEDEMAKADSVKAERVRLRNEPPPRLRTNGYRATTSLACDQINTAGIIREFDA